MVHCLIQARRDLIITSPDRNDISKKIKSAYEKCECTGNCDCWVIGLTWTRPRPTMSLPSRDVPAAAMQVQCTNKMQTKPSRVTHLMLDVSMSEWCLEIGGPSTQSSQCPHKHLTVWTNSPSLRYHPHSTDWRVGSITLSPYPIVNSQDQTYLVQLTITQTKNKITHSTQNQSKNITITHNQNKKSQIALS